MNEINWKNIDLNLLSVFTLLMQELSLTVVAQKLSIGQPAVSHALARLRKQIDDPLFVRAGRLMEPTPRAISLHREIAPALETIEAALREDHPFDPLVCEHVLRVAMSDDVQMAFLPQIIEQVRQQMPNVKLIIQQTNYIQAAKMLEQKQASVVVGYLDKLPAAAKVQKIKRVGYKVLAPFDLVKRLSLKTYCTLPHVLVTFAGDLVGYVDETLAKMEVQRIIQLSVPAFGVLPFVLQNSQCLATVPEYIADTLSGQTDLTAKKLPFESPEFDLSIAWREATDNDPAEKLLRGIIVGTIRKG